MRRRSGMTLILVLMVMLIGGAFIYVAFTMAENAHTSSMNMVTQDRLYNAAQSGLEWGKAILWANREDIDLDVYPEPDTNLANIQVRLDDSTADTTNGLVLTAEEAGSLLTFDEPAIALTVQIFDCNYSIPADTLPPDLPPLFPAGDGTGAGASTGLPGGTSAIIDPGRFIPLGGGAGEHRYVIRSEALIDGKTFSVETMVVMTL